MRRLLCAVGLLMLTVACGGTPVHDAPLEAADLAGASGRELVISGWYGPCDDVLEPEVSETDTEVRVRVPVRRFGEACAAVVERRTTTVTLQQPLGDRPVVDARTHERLPGRR